MEQLILIIEANLIISICIVIAVISIIEAFKTEK